MPSSHFFKPGRADVQESTPSLHAGDVVEVRSAAEIFSTLDHTGALEGLPFMPEMAELCGQRFKVSKRCDKICDTIHWTGSRRLPNSVMLDDLRCNGGGHDGCQAECRLMWKERWLRRVQPGEAAGNGASDESAKAKLKDLVARNSKRTNQDGDKPFAQYRCQATELFTSTSRLRVFDPRPYVGQYTGGNVTAEHFLRVTSRAVIEEPMRKLGLVPEVPLPGTRTTPVRDEPLNLKPGEWVQVKSKEEIAATLTPGGRNRGLWFDREMIGYCGGTFKVRQRVSQFVDDQNGKMIQLKTDAVTLEDVTCTGNVSLRRWFCPRNIYLYWRECWLRRVDQPAPSG